MYTRRWLVAHNITSFDLRGLSSIDLVNVEVLDTAVIPMGAEECVCLGLTTVLTQAKSAQSVINLQFLIPKKRTALSHCGPTPQISQHPGSSPL